MSNTDNTPKLVSRSKRLSFMKIDNSYVRMTGFTSLSESKNPKEYSRQYVDEISERSDVVGYAPSIAFSFDRHTNTPVHTHIASIADSEVIGTDAQVEIITVDIFDGNDTAGYAARKRTFSVIPDSTGDGTDALIYSGNFKAAGDNASCLVTTADDWKTCTIKQ